MSEQVPEGWMDLSVSDVFEMGRGRVISKDEIRNNVGQYPVFSSQSTNNGEMGRINTFDFEGEYVTWTTDGAYAGTVFYRKGRFNCTNVCGTLYNSGHFEVNMKFAAEYLSTVAKNHVSYVGNPKLMNNTFGEINILLPPLQEQKKIASILTSMDELIENTQKQIDKLQDLKKATMHKLLTKGIGHTEFKDSELGRIPKSWENKKIGDITTLIMGQSPSSETYNQNKNGIPFFQGKADFGVRYPNIRYWCTSPTKVAPMGSILFTVRAPVGAVNFNNVEACIGRGLASILGIFIDNNFLYQSLIYNKINFEILGQGSTFEAINANELKEFKLKCPPIEEQKKIASFLNFFDNKIDIKEEKLKKYQSLKKSLMQDLLTGKVRVKVN